MPGLMRRAFARCWGPLIPTRLRRGWTGYAGPSNRLSYAGLLLLGRASSVEGAVAVWEVYACEARSRVTKKWLRGMSRKKRSRVTKKWRLDMSRNERSRVTKMWRRGMSRKKRSHVTKKWRRGMPREKSACVSACITKIHRTQPTQKKKLGDERRITVGQS